MDGCARHFAPLKGAWFSVLIRFFGLGITVCPVHPLRPVGFSGGAAWNRLVSASFAPHAKLRCGIGCLKGEIFLSSFL